MTKNRKKVRIKKDNVFICFLIVLLIGLIISMVILAKNILKKEKVEVVEVQVVDKLDEYGYYLTDHNTDYYKKLYNELKDTLSSEKVDEEKYVSLLSQLFTADFYDLNSKLSKNDVGGVQFVSSEYQDSFIKTASTTGGIYYYVKSDLYGDRKQDLPVIKKVDVLSIENEAFSHESINDTNAYVVVLNVEYEQDLGYPKTVTLTIVHNEKKLEVVEVK